MAGWQGLLGLKQEGAQVAVSSSSIQPVRPMALRLAHLKALELVQREGLGNRCQLVPFACKQRLYLQVDFFAYNYEQCMLNYKVLQQAFDKLNIARVREPTPFASLPLEHSVHTRRTLGRPVNIIQQRHTCIRACPYGSSPWERAACPASLHANVWTLTFCGETLSPPLAWPVSCKLRAAGHIQSLPSLGVQQQQQQCTHECI